MQHTSTHQMALSFLWIRNVNDSRLLLRSSAALLGMSGHGKPLQNRTQQYLIEYNSIWFNKTVFDTIQLHITQYNLLYCIQNNRILYNRTYITVLYTLQLYLMQNNSISYNTVVFYTIVLYVIQNKVLYFVQQNCMLYNTLYCIQYNFFWYKTTVSDIILLQSPQVHTQPSELNRVQPPVIDQQKCTIWTQEEQQIKLSTKC